MKRKLTVKNPSLVLAGEFAAFGAGAVILLVFIASTLDASMLQTGQQAAVVTSVLADLANSDRELNHESDLTVSPTLAAIAQLKANDMAQNGYFAHTSPEGKDPWYWFRMGGYSFTYAGENLAVDFSDSADVERAWMGSPTHRANILNGHYTEIGIATAVGTYQGRRTIFVVQEFGTPSRTVAVATTQPAAAAPRATVAAAPVASSSVPVQVAGASTSKSVPVPKAVATHQASSPASSTPASVGAAPPAEATQSEQGALAAADVQPTVAAPMDSLWASFAASPRTTLRYAYYLFALLVLGALVIETGFELQRRHRKHATMAVALMLLMAVLFLSADSFVFSKPVIVDRETTSAGV